MGLRGIVLSEIICGINESSSGEIIHNFDTDNYKKDWNPISGFIIF